MGGLGRFRNIKEYKGYKVDSGMSKFKKTDCTAEIAGKNIAVSYAWVARVIHAQMMPSFVNPQNKAQAKNRHYRKGTVAAYVRAAAQFPRRMPVLRFSSLSFRPHRYR